MEVVSEAGGVSFLACGRAASDGHRRDTEKERVQRGRFVPSEPARGLLGQCGKGTSSVRSVQWFKGSNNGGGGGGFAAAILKLPASLFRGRREKVSPLFPVLTGNVQSTERRLLHDRFVSLSATQTPGVTAAKDSRHPRAVGRSVDSTFGANLTKTADVVVEPPLHGGRNAKQVVPVSYSNARCPDATSATTVAIPQKSALLVECLEITGGARLTGHVHISGAKNSALAVLAGALCCEEPLLLRMVPDLHDIRRMFQVLQSVGAKVTRGMDGSDSVVGIDASSLTSSEPCPDTVRKLRASFFVVGSLLARRGEAVVPLPGGCNIGARPIDLHVRGLEALGARVDIRQGKVHAAAVNGKKLIGGSYYLDYPSVGATETLMMAATLAEGETVLSNAAQEPEVVDLADFLISCGGRIKGAGTNCIIIEGVKRLHATDFTIIPDRIEAGTFLMAGAISRSEITMSPICVRHLTAVISKMHSIGCKLKFDRPDSLTILAPLDNLRGTDVTTLPYPGFPTDMQPQLMSLLCQCDGQSIVRETVFESRMRHVEELQKMGAKIKVTGNSAIIAGRDRGSSLYGAPVMATDLRAGASLVLAGLAAGGVTHIEGVHHIDRGYEKLDEKLRQLGAKIKRIPCLPAELNLP